MSDIELAEIADRTTVFAKLNPAQKERVVRALHAKGHVVGFLGDGINDSPALKAADVGISVDTAVDIAKEFADIILLEKSLARPSGGRHRKAARFLRTSQNTSRWARARISGTCSACSGRAYSCRSCRWRRSRF